MELGIKVRDQITGFVGTVTGRAEYISGCTQCLVAPEAKGGDFKDGQWFDIQRLEQIKGKQVILKNDKTPGPDKPAPKR